MQILGYDRPKRPASMDEPYSFVISTLQSSKVTAGFYDWLMLTVSMQIDFRLNSLLILPSTVYSMSLYPDSM